MTWLCRAASGRDCGWLREASILFCGPKISGCQHQEVTHLNELCLSVNSMHCFSCVCSTYTAWKKAVLYAIIYWTLMGQSGIITSEQISQGKKGAVGQREEEGAPQLGCGGWMEGGRACPQGGSTEEPRLSGKPEHRISSSPFRSLK